MPSAGSGEILGTTKVPNGHGNSRPPPSCCRSTFCGSLFGVAWHELQPPILNMVLPLSAFGVYCGSANADTVAGIVTIQNTEKPMIAPAMTTAAALRSVKCFFMAARPSRLRFRNTHRLHGIDHQLSLQK